MPPRWVSWVFLGFLAYVVVVGNFRANEPVARDDEEEAIAAEEEPRSYPELSKFADVERWKKELNPEYKKLAEACTYEAPATGLGMKVVLDKVGTGSAAHCGQNITVMLKHWDDNARHYKEETITALLGEHKIRRPLEAALVGIRVGGERTIILPAEKGHAVKIITATRID